MNAKQKVTFVSGARVAILNWDMGINSNMQMYLTTIFQTRDFAGVDGMTPLKIAQ